MRKTLRLCLVILLSLPGQIVFASQDADTRLAFSADFTGSVVGSLESGIAQCQAIATIYRFDCYRQNYRRARRIMNGKPDYRMAQKALRHVEATLNSFVKKNTDETAPHLSVGGKTYKAVTPEAVKPGAAAFDQARSEAVTILLRSDGRAKVHYQRIASVVGSNKLIIRSDLQVQSGFA